MLSCWPSSQMHSAGCHLRLDRTYSFVSSDCRLHDRRWHIGTSGFRHVAAFQRAGPPLVLGLPGADHSATATRLAVRVHLGQRLNTLLKHLQTILQASLTQIKDRRP